MSSLAVSGSSTTPFHCPSADYFISNGEFEMTTNNPSNVYINNGQLYIMPTLTSDTIDGGYSSIMNGANYTLSGCTAQGGK